MIAPVIGGLWHRQKIKRVERDARVLKGLGFETVRIFVPWASVETRQGKWDFSDPIRRSEAAIDAGLKIDYTFSMAYSPRYAHSRQIWPENHKGEVAKPSSVHVSGATPSIFHPAAKNLYSRFVHACLSHLIDPYYPNVDSVRAGFNLNELNYYDKFGWWWMVSGMIDWTDPVMWNDSDRAAFYREYYQEKRSFIEWLVALLSSADVSVTLFLAGSEDIFDDPGDPDRGYESHVDRFVDTGHAHPVIYHCEDQRGIAEIARKNNCRLVYAGVDETPENTRRFVGYAAEYGMQVGGQVPNFEVPEDVAAAVGKREGMISHTINKASTYYRMARKRDIRKGRYITVNGVNIVPKKRYQEMIRALQIWGQYAE